MTALLTQALAILKDSFEKVIFWLVLAVFLFFSIKLGTQWGHSKGVGISLEDELGLRQKYNYEVLNEGIPAKETLGASAGLFAQKPILYYRDFYKRNIFSFVPELKIKGKLVIKGIVIKTVPITEYEYIGVIEINEELVAIIRNKSTNEEFYVRKGQIIEKHKVLDITKTYMLLSDEGKKKDVKIEIKK